MAAQIPVNTSTEWGRKLRRWRDLLNEVLNLGDEVRGKMIQGIAGGDYSELEEQFGLATGDGATCFAELDSVYGKLAADQAVSNVNAAINQFVDIVG